MEDQKKRQTEIMQLVDVCLELFDCTKIMIKEGTDHNSFKTLCTVFKQIKKLEIKVNEKREDLWKKT